ncbi:hypothetical protein [Edaphosphingomonas haloaromaticamans]|uniref:Uncharacterized protein n=1 Tax=Edaphosphingomonas haloaromaticamans TaxID=653954 RepID=A0A1S1HHP5_9SPHN|nr:hypothetical protein [Sphingomonas haloaromaticamans]OHT21597.1 hypothetical protein BHE75_03608 [Sphingomonas haloaromaticamans]
MPDIAGLSAIFSRGAVGGVGAGFSNTHYEGNPMDGAGMWIRTEEGEKLFFRRYSSTGHWGFFSDSNHHSAREHKLPLAGLRPWHKERQT